MSLEFDPMTTLVLLWAVVFSSLGFLVVLWFQTGRSRFVKYWIAGILLMVIGYTLTDLGGFTPDWVSSFLANGVILSGLLSLTRGYQCFLGVSFNKELEWLSVAIYLLPFGYFCFLEPDKDIQVVLMSLVFAVVYFNIAWLAVDDKHPLATSARVLIVGFHFVFCLIFSIRFVTYSIVPQNEFNNLPAINQWEFIFIVWSQVVQVFLFYLLAIGEKNHRIQQVIERDPVSGLYNRNTFQVLGEERLAELNRNKEMVCLVLFQLCGNTLINQGPTRQALIIAQFANILKEHCSEHILARDEFNVLAALLEYTSYADAEAMAKSVAIQFDRTLQSSDLSDSVALQVFVAHNQNQENFYHLYTLAYRKRSDLTQASELTQDFFSRRKQPSSL